MQGHTTCIPPKLAVGLCQHGGSHEAKHQVCIGLRFKIELCRAVTPQWSGTRVRGHLDGRT